MARRRVNYWQEDAPVRGSRGRLEPLWREPEADDLPSLPTERTPLTEFLRAWSDQYADHLLRHAAVFAQRRPYLALRALYWCLQHVIEARDEVEWSERINGELQTFNTDPGGKYLIRHGALVRVSRTVIGRSVRERDAVIEEVHADVHIRCRPKERGTAPVTSAAARARLTKAKVEDARKMIEAIQRDRLRLGEDLADLPELMQLLKKTELGRKTLLEKALQQVSPTLKRKVGEHRKRRK
jgi:hypothetical protein